MKYEDLVQRISCYSGITEENIRAVLFSLPDALISLEEGDFVRTPLGVFRTHRTKARVVVPPKRGPEDGVFVPSVLKIRLKSGVRLSKKIS